MKETEEYRPLLAGISDREGTELCAQLRQELVDDVSKTGGHLASNLGAVELTVAIHRVFDTRQDRLVFDVGHQCYCHKILTGRREAMATLRQYGGIAGFPKPVERRLHRRTRLQLRGGGFRHGPGAPGFGGAL